MSIRVGRVHPVTKKITATQKYVTTVSFSTCPEAGTWTCEDMRTRQPKARRNHWSMRNHSTLRRTRRHFGSGGLEAVVVAVLEGLRGEGEKGGVKAWSPSLCCFSFATCIGAGRGLVLESWVVSAAEMTTCVLFCGKFEAV